MAPMIGEFEIDPGTIVEEPLLDKTQEHVFEIKKSERKVGKDSGKPYINLDLVPVDAPSKHVFHVYGLSAEALSKKSSGISFKKFLDKLALPYTTTAQDLVGIRFKAKVKYQGAGDEAEEKIDSVIGRAE